MDKIKFREVLKRYQDGTANETEKALVEAWYQSYNTDEESAINGDIKNRILSSINAAVTPQAIVPKRILGRYLKIAAAVLLVSGIGFIAHLRSSNSPSAKYTIISTKAGEVKRLVLADSSLVWVNASSRVRFPQQFNSRLRELFLEEGEAFFEVKHKTTQPFIVHVQKLQVHVLGTSFNIDAYGHAAGLTVMVATGKVGITQGNKTLTFLTPGQEITFNNATDKFTTQNADIEATRSWEKGYTDLKQASFTELAGIMKNQFGVNLKVGSPRVNGYRFTLRVQQNIPLNQTLQMIIQIHNTHYRKEGDEIIIY